MPGDGPILLYDGVCALCNRMVKFILRRDAPGRFRFASLQSDVAAGILARHGRDPRELDTVVVVIDCGRPTERLLDRSSAAVFVLKAMPGLWRVAGRALGLIPTPLRNFGYLVVARTRYRAFGKYETCPIPSPQHRGRFLDQ